MREEGPVVKFDWKSVEDRLERAARLCRPYAGWLAIAVAIGVFTLHLSFCWRTFVDDAYITFRYARNFANGLGLVYNPEERVEGFTSVLWTLWISLGIKLGADPLFFAKITGFVLSVATLVYVGRVIHPLVSLCLACSGVFVYWSTAGLETPLLATVLVFALGELYRGKYKRSTILFGILPWIRPDGVIFTLGVFAPLALLRARDSRRRGEVFDWRKALALGATIVVPYVVLLLWRHAYYGDWQPNTYYAKVAMPWDAGFWKQLRKVGITYPYGFWASHGALAILAAASLAYAVMRRNALMIATHLTLLACQAYFAFVGGDWMSMFRWFAPLMPIYLALCVPLFAPVRVRWPALERYRPAAAVLAAAIVAASLLQQSYGELIVVGKLRYNAKHDIYLQRLGRLLKGEQPFDESVLLGDIGAIGWESNLHVVDGAGLVDKHIARLPAIHFWKSDLAYFMAQNPEWVIVRLHYYYAQPDANTVAEFSDAIANQPDAVNFPESLWERLAPSGRWTFEQQLLGSPEFHARYSTVFVTPEFDQPQYMAVFCRLDVCDSERAARLRTWAPNLGIVKSQLGRADADAYLGRAVALIDGEETSRVEFFKRKHDRPALRAIASNWRLPRWNRIDAYTALGLEEYEWKEYNAAASDFHAAYDAGGRLPFHYSNIGFALQALGRTEEAKYWFNKAKP
jgi:hypothetical protein